MNYVNKDREYNLLPDNAVDYCNNSQGLMPVCFLKAAEKWEMEE